MIAHWLADATGFALFEGRLFRAGSATLLAAFFVFVSMPGWIRILRRIDASSDLDPRSQRKSPPIMGGVVLVLAIVASSLVFALPGHVLWVILTILVAFSAVGLVDDIAKVRSKRRIARGLEARKTWAAKADGISARLRLGLYFAISLAVAWASWALVPHLREGEVLIPFVKASWLTVILPGWAFILFVSFCITSTANGVNFTDGLDSLVSVPLITCALFAGVVAYISGNAIWSSYLLLPHLPGVDELFVVAGATMGALGAYLWYNSPPAEIYMGDAGAIGLGGMVATMFVFVKAELFLPIVGFIFFAEAVSVLLQVLWFRASGGRRIFRRAPLHHHFQLQFADRYRRRQDADSKIIWRFHLVSVFCLVVGLVLFFKVR